VGGKNMAKTIQDLKEQLKGISTNLGHPKNFNDYLLFASSNVCNPDDDIEVVDILCDTTAKRLVFKLKG